MKRQMIHLLFAAIFASFSNISNLHAQNNGGDPPPPPVTYEIRSYEMPVPCSSFDVKAINRLGQIVGSYTDAVTGNKHGFLYDPLVNDQQAFDVNNLVLVPEGMRISMARDINDFGQIVGRIDRIDGPYEEFPFVIDLYQATGPEMIVLTNLGGDPNWPKTNNDGDVIVSYQMAGNDFYEMYHFNPGDDFQNDADDFFEVLPFQLNSSGWHLSSSNDVNPAKIVGRLDTGEVFRYSLGLLDPPVPLDELATGGRAINDYGVIVGGIPVPWDNNPRKSTPRPFRYDERNTQPLETFDITTTPAHTLNNDGDFTISVASILYFYHDGSGFFLIDENTPLVGDPQLIAQLGQTFFSIRDLTDRGVPFGSTQTASDFPIMCGLLSWDGEGTPIVLIPLSSEPTPGVSVTPTNGLVTTETGGTDSFEVVLDSEPTDDVTIGISSSKPGEGLLEVPDNPGGPLLDAYDLVFDSSNWDQPQTVTVVGQGDGVADNDDGTYTIITDLAVSDDGDYHGLDAEDVQVINLDPSSSATYSTLDEPDPDPPIDIPDNDPEGISSTILVGDHNITGLTVSLNIDHPRPSADLKVYLYDPNNDPDDPESSSVQLDVVPGDNPIDLADIDVNNSLGFWTILVIDDRKKKTGTLLDWSITVDY